MKTDSTYIGVVLDRSGSMGMIAGATRDGYNEFLRAQKVLPGDCDLLLAQFDHEYKITYDGPLAVAVELDQLNYVPRGSTALLDAIGKTVTSMGRKFDLMPEDQRPAKVLVVIITDGYENSSRSFSRAEVFDLITRQRDTYSWQFLFLGAGQDAIAEAATFGIAANAAADYNATSVSVGSTYTVTSNMVGALRNGDLKVASFSADDRKQMLETK